MQRLPTNIHSKNLLAQLDLNLLRLFLSIYHTRNLTQTAEQLHISQSAVSHALNRLRQALDDALFYREKGGLHPTAYARRIYPILHQAFGQLEDAFSVTANLTADELTQLAKQRFSQVTIAMHDEVELIVFDRLFERLHAILPQCKITSSRLNRRELAYELKSGQVDFAIDVARVVEDSIRHQCLISDKFMVAYYAPNFADEPNFSLDRARYFASQHITVSSSRLGYSIEDQLLSQAGWQRHISVRCQHYASACRLLRQDKLLLTLPELWARHFVPCDVDWVVTDMPVSLPTIDLHGYWQHDNHEPLQAWLRDQIINLF